MFISLGFAQVIPKEKGKMGREGKGVRGMGMDSMDWEGTGKDAQKKKSKVVTMNLSRCLLVLILLVSTITYRSRICTTMSP